MPGPGVQRGQRIQALGDVVHPDDKRTFCHAVLQFMGLSNVEQYQWLPVGHPLGQHFFFDFDVRFGCFGFLGWDGRAGWTRCLRGSCDRLQNRISMSGAGLALSERSAASSAFAYS